jgi:hypothetical protein
VLKKRRLPARHVAPHFGRRLVLAYACIDDLAQQIVFRPGQGLINFSGQTGHLHRGDRLD